jgi:hypothetical protein
MDPWSYGLKHTHEWRRSVLAGDANVVELFDEDRGATVKKSITILGIWVKPMPHEENTFLVIAEVP